MIKYAPPGINIRVRHPELAVLLEIRFREVATSVHV